MKPFLLSLFVMCVMSVGVGLTKPIDSSLNPPPPPVPAKQPRPKKPVGKLPAHKPPEAKTALQTIAREVPIIAQASPKKTIAEADDDPVPPAPEPEPRIVAKVVEQPDPPPSPVSVEIEGMTAYLVGERAMFRLLENGNVASRTWTILPAGTTGLRIYESGTTADFVARTPGAYVLLVAVAGKDGSVAQTFHSFELHTTLPMPEEEQAPEAPKRASTKKQLLGKAEGAQLVRDFTNEIESPNKARDMAQIRSALILVAGNIDTGVIIIPANVDKAAYAVGKIRGQAKAALGTLGPWQQWFDSLQSFFTELDKRGGFKTPQNVSAAARSVAEVLDGK